MSALAEIELPAHQRRMIELFAQGLTYATIAKLVHYSDVQVGRLIQPHITPEIATLHKQNYRSDPSMPTASTIAKLYMEGFTYSEIARRFDISTKPVAGQVKRLLTKKQRELGRRRHSTRKVAPKEAVLISLEPRVRKLIKAGQTNPEIRRALRISKSTLETVIARLNLDVRLLKRPIVTQYSRKDKLKALKEAAALSKGTYLSERSFEALRPTHPHWPSLSPYLSIQDWDAWLKEAGLPTRTSKRVYKPRTSEQDCRAAIERVAFKLNRIFSALEYDANRLPGDPCSRNLRHRFGNHKWLSALEYFMPGSFERHNKSS